MWDISASGPAAATPAAPTTREQPQHTPVPQRSAPDLHEMIAQAREQAETQRARVRLSGTKRYGDAPLEAYARLARARNQSDVGAAASYARRRITQLKTALRQDEENGERIRAAISQLQKAVVRAARKKSDLGREELVQRRQERCAQEEQRREELRMHQELQRQKAQRVIRESGYLSEAAISERMAAQMALERVQHTVPSPTASAVAAERYSAAAAPPAPAPQTEAFCTQA